MLPLRLLCLGFLSGVLWAPLIASYTLIADDIHRTWAGVPWMFLLEMGVSGAVTACLLQRIVRRASELTHYLAVAVMHTMVAVMVLGMIEMVRDVPTQAYHGESFSLSIYLYYCIFVLAVPSIVGVPLTALCVRGMKRSLVGGDAKSDV
jgi:hypothetical protein